MYTPLEEIREIERQILLNRERQYRETQHASYGYDADYYLDYYYDYHHGYHPYDLRSDAVLRIEIGPGDNVSVEGDLNRMRPLSIHVGGGRVVIQETSEEVARGSRLRPV